MKKRSSPSKKENPKRAVSPQKTRKRASARQPVFHSAESSPIHVRVSRYNPTIDFSPRTHEYTLPLKQGESVLDLLTRIKHTHDGSLTFRGSCGYGGCGSCGVKVNGKPVLGCVTQVTDVLDTHNGLRIDPLQESVIKDLVTDEKPFFDELLRVKPWITLRAHDERRHHRMGVGEVKKLGNTFQCMLCGLCNATVESEKKGELGPAAFVKAYRYLHDARDATSTRWNDAARNLPVHYSLEKANACPRNIFPGDKIREIREAVNQPKKILQKKGRNA